MLYRTILIFRTILIRTNVTSTIPPTCFRRSQCCLMDQKMHSFIENTFVVTTFKSFIDLDFRWKKRKFECQDYLIIIDYFYICPVCYKNQSTLHVKSSFYNCLIFCFCGRFHLRFTSSFFARRSQERKKIQLNHQYFYTFGICAHKNSL